MSELPHVHAPHQGIRSWRDFFVDISVITIGLLLAIGLQQGVEYIHHQHQRAQLEERMRETFESNSRTTADTLRVLGAVRAYLVELQAAVIARRHGKTMKTPAPPSYTVLTIPNLGPYEAAQATGDVALLSLGRILVYDRLSFTHTVVEEDLQHYRHAMRGLRAFRKRFDTSPDFAGLHISYSPPDLATLSAAELVEYQALIGVALEAIDQLVVRLKRLDVQTQAVLNGASDERELIEAIARDQGQGAKAPTGGIQ